MQSLQRSLETYLIAVNAVELVTGFGRDAIESASRGYDVTFARHMVCALMHSQDVSTVNISACLGRDRSTVTHAIGSVKDRASTNPRDKAIYAKCQEVMQRSLSLALVA